MVVGKPTANYRRPEIHSLPSTGKRQLEQVPSVSAGFISHDAVPGTTRKSLHLPITDSTCRDRYDEDHKLGHDSIADINT